MADTNIPDWLRYMMGGAGIGGGLSSLFGQQDPSKEALPFEQQAYNQLPQYFQPYMNAGQNALGELQPQLQNLVTNPGGVTNQIGESFHQSPGFQFALNNALSSANRSAAAGGLAGSPSSQLQNMGTATQLANQDYYNWLGKAMGMYGQGLSGLGGLAQMGQQSAQGLGENLSNILSNEAMLKYAGAQQKNQNQSSGLGSLLGGIFSFL